MLYRYQNLVLQFVVLVCLGVIGGLIYHNYKTILDGDNALTKKIDDIDVRATQKISPMPAFDKTLTPQQVADLVAFLLD